MPLSVILGGFETLHKQFFHIFGAREKIKNFRKILDFSEKSTIFFDFSLIFLLPIFPSQNHFQPNRKPIFHRKIDRKKRFFSPCFLCISCLYPFIHSELAINRRTTGWGTWNPRRVVMRLASRRIPRLS